MATRDKFYTIGYSFRVGFSTVSAIVTEVCEAICANLQNIYLPEPITKIWKKSEKGFRNLWLFPIRIGSVDGKHVTIKCPNKTGSNYWCYLNKFSIVLLAIVGPDYFSLFQLILAVLVKIVMEEFLKFSTWKKIRSK